MIPAIQIHETVLRKLRGYSKASDVKPKHIDDAVEEAIQIFMEKMVAIAEKNEKIREDLRPIKRMGEPVSFIKYKDEIIVELPTDYYRRTGIVVIVRTDTCPDRELKVVYPLDKEYREAKKDSNWGPSYEWGHTVAEDSYKGIHIAISKEMIPRKVYLDYYRKPLYVRYAEGAEDGEYKGKDGHKVNTNQGLELDNNYQSRIITDLATLIISVDRESPSFGNRLQSIFQIDKLYN